MAAFGDARWLLQRRRWAQPCHSAHVRQWPQADRRLTSAFQSLRTFLLVQQTTVLHDEAPERGNKEAFASFVDFLDSFQVSESISF